MDTDDADMLVKPMLKKNVMSKVEKSQKGLLSGNLISWNFEIRNAIDD